MADNMEPVAGAVPPKAVLMKPTQTQTATLKIKPIIRRPTIGGARPELHPGLKLPTQTALKPSADAGSPVSAAPAPMDQLKSVTQKLKGVTQEIPQQAILHKTGIIADPGITEAQKQAAKARTARISLSDAIGVAPVSDASAAPLKTIRIKRPVDISVPPSASASSAPAQSADVSEAAAPAAAPENEAAPAAAPKPTLTQRKTLKIARLGAQIRPSGRFGVKQQTADSAAEADASAEDVPEVADMPAPAPLAAPRPAGDTVPDVPKAMGIVGIILQLAACVTMGALGYYLLQDAQLPLFCGGCGWGQ